MNRSPLQSERTTRVGSLTVELLVAGALLATVMAMIIPFMAQVSKVNSEISDRELALRAVRDVITELQVSSETIPTLPANLNDRLPNAALSVDSKNIEDAEVEKVTVAISWENRFGSQSKPVALSFWTTNGGNEQ